MGYTREQLLQMGAQPAASQKSYTKEELLKLGAKPVGQDTSGAVGGQPSGADFEVAKTQKSPVGALTRAKLSFGNKEGIKNYLLSQGYQNVAFDENDSPYVVKDGKLLPVNKAGLDLGDIAEQIGTIPETIGWGAGVTGGGALGTLVAPGAGTAVGGVVGSGLGTAAGELVRQDIGRKLGVQAEQPLGVSLGQAAESGAWGAGTQAVGLLAKMAKKIPGVKTAEKAVGKAVISAGKTAKDIVPSAAKKAGATIINSLIKPLLKDFSYGKDPGRTVSKYGIIGNSFEELERNIGTAVSDVGQQLGNVYKKSNKKVDLSDILDPINQTIKTLRKEAPGTHAAVISRLEVAKSDLARHKLRASTPIEKAFKVKELVGGLTKWTGNKSDDQVVNKTLKQTYGKLAEKLVKAEPSLEQLNEEFGDLLSAKIATQYRDKILSRQNLLKLVPQLSIGGGALMSVMSMNPLPALAGLAGAGISRAMESPAVKTRTAAFLGKVGRTAEESARLEGRGADVLGLFRPQIPSRRVRRSARIVK